eukprot:gene2356-29343_t
MKFDRGLLVATLLVVLVGVASQDNNPRAPLHQVLEHARELSRKLDQAKLMLESLAGKVGANEATAIKEFLVEQLKTDSAATIGYPDTGSVRNTPPSPPSSGSGSGNACESRSVPSGPSCWDKSTFGPATFGGSHSCGNRANITDFTFELTQHQCQASNLIWGGAGMNTARASARLNECADGKGLNIYVVGGSVSAGGKVSQCSSPGGQITTACKQDNQTREGRFQSLECKALSWTSKLEQALNNHFPCSGAGNVKHTVLNHARSAVASDFWFAHFMAARADPTHPIHSADIILLETSANDVSDIGDISPDHEWRDSPADQFPAAMKYTELLVRLLRGLKHKPLIMWVTAGFCCNNDHNSEAATYPLLKRYDVPYASIAGALFPFEGLEGPADRPGYWTPRTGKYVPTTLVPTTLVPTTLVPTMLVPTMLVPTMLVPTTLVPTTLVPTTLVPTMLVPSMLVPTTLVPSMLVPSMLVPTTLVPTTLVPTMLVPTTYNTHRGDFFENVFFVDSRHPTPFGHEMVASMMLKRLSTQLDPCARSGGTANGAGGSWFFGQPDIEYMLPKATKHITEKMKQGKVLLDGMAESDAIDAWTTPTIVDLQTNEHAAIVDSKGFAFAEDVPGKPGQVGWMRATLVVPSTGTIKCTGGIPTTEPEASQVQSYLSAPRDLMWKPKVSERDAIVYMWRFPRIARGRCGWLKIDIAEDPKKNAKAGRSENKVKLLDPADWGFAKQRAKAASFLAGRFDQELGLLKGVWAGGHGFEPLGYSLIDVNFFASRSLMPYNATMASSIGRAVDFWLQKANYTRDDPRENMFGGYPAPPNKLWMVTEKVNHTRRGYSPDRAYGVNAGVKMALANSLAGNSSTARSIMADIAGMWNASNNCIMEPAAVHDGFCYTRALAYFLFGVRALRLDSTYFYGGEPMLRNGAHSTTEPANLALLAYDPRIRTAWFPDTPRG